MNGRAPSNGCTWLQPLSNKAVLDFKASLGGSQVKAMQGTLKVLQRPLKQLCARPVALDAAACRLALLLSVEVFARHVTMLRLLGLWMRWSCRSVSRPVRSS